MKKKQTFTINLLYFLTLAAAVVVAANVFLVTLGQYHLWSGTDLGAYASSASTRTVTLQARRGSIYDRNGVVIAQDVQSYNIICYLDKSRLGIKNRPAYVDDLVKTSQVLAEVLGMDAVEVYQTLSTKQIEGKYQTELGSKGRGLSKETKDLIESYDLNGVEFISTVSRQYPLGTFASYLIGYATANNEENLLTGKMGVELTLNDELTGVNGTKKYQADKSGYILPGMKSEVVEAVNGNDVILTLDQALQETLESAFEMTAELFDTERIWGSIMEIDTGKILAWGQSPGFDLNERVIDDYNNYGSQFGYEPGSTMKVFTYAAAIDSGAYDYTGLVDSSDYCYGQKGGVPYRVPCGSAGQIGRITNAGTNKHWGMVDYDHGLIYSSNTVTASVLSELISPSVYKEYLNKFGFFQKVETDGISEIEGKLTYNYPSEKLALTYGQGSTVTMLQMMQAYSAVFGDGNMVKPYFIDEIRSSYNSSEVLYKAETEITGTPISQETAEYLQSVLYRVINDEDGTGKHYRIDETELIGKTGTAQIASGGSYSNSKTIASIMVALPANDPKYMIYYAFEGGYDRNAHYKTEPIKTVIRKVAQLYNLTDSLNVDTDGNKVQVEIRDEIMPELINHSVEYALNKCEDLGLNALVFGEGNEVIFQMPEGGKSVITGDRIFVLTDQNQITMPDMTGWSRSDVTAFWTLANKTVKLGIVMDGYGVVVSQNIPAGTVIQDKAELSVKLES